MASVPVTSANMSTTVVTDGSYNLTLGNSSGITLSNANSVSGVLSVGSDGNLMWNHSNVMTFSKDTLDGIFKGLKAEKYTRRYAEVYLEFMFLNSMLDNLEYLEYKAALDKELPQ